MKKAKKEKKDKEEKEEKEDAAAATAATATPTEEPSTSSPPPADDPSAAASPKPKPDEIDTSATPADDATAVLSPTAEAAAASLAEQSKLRSSSFRRGSVTSPLSPGASPPDGETAADIYRKQAARIEELERENKKLGKEAADAEKRWKKAEEELEDLREAEDGKKDDATSGENEKLVSSFVWLVGTSDLS